MSLYADIKVKEQTPENLMRGNNIFEPPRLALRHFASCCNIDLPRFMSVAQAIEQLLYVERKRNEKGKRFE